MPRITLLDPVDMDPDQLGVHDAAVAGRRGHSPLPLLAWLHSPEFASRAQRLGEYVRYETTLDPRLSELAILVVARAWAAQYEWSAHKREALKAGLSEEVIAAIASGSVPLFKRSDEELIYTFATSVILTHFVDDALYAKAKTVFGDRAIVELIGILGYYTLIAMTLNVFKIGSEVNELEPLPPV